MLLWAEGFDQYGLTETFMLDGLWSEVSINHVLSSAVARTGTYSLSHNGGTSTPNPNFVRRQFGSALTTVGVGAAFYPVSLPSVDDQFCIAEFRDAANTAQIWVGMQTTGAIAVRRGSRTGTLLATSATLLTAATWNQLEIRVTISNTVGTVEVRLNGSATPIINLSGIDTQATALAETSQVAMAGIGPTLSPVAVSYWDDFFAWDTSGANNNQFLGDKKCYLILPDADTAEADWVPDTGVEGFSRIDEVPPDDDTSYVEASVVGDISDYGLQSLPSEVTTISAVYAIGRTRKTDAGTCDVTQSMVSGASVAAGTSRALTTAYTYRPDVFETDPATGVLWTVSGFNAAQLRFTRTA